MHIQKTWVKRLILLTSSGGVTSGGGLDAVPSKTITSFLISSEVSSRVLSMSEFFRTVRNLFCFAAFFKYASLMRQHLLVPIGGCTDKNATDVARTRSEE